MNTKTIYLLLTVFFLASSYAQSQWINEFHYDNAGGDANEGVEIAGPAGTDLSCWTVVPYNGNGGGQYSVTALSGTIPDEGCGYGAIWFPITGLQNGSPDGIALVDCFGVVAMFISYEGSFTATNGPASGMTSTDIGVAEDPAPVSGDLQLTGTGSAYSDFTWGLAGTDSHNTLNAGQNITPCGGNSITITALNTPPFSIDCQASTDDAGSVNFTSSGTFNSGNIYSVQLSDAVGGFGSPLVIGTLTSTANSGTINITIPSTLSTGTGYAIRIISDNPAAISGTSSSFTITQNNQCTASLPSSQGLLINEWSNGSSGSKEYYEFVVAGQCGAIVDISGYILDDNNGTFSTVFPSSSGVAPGHLRLTNDPQWQAIPVGSLIVIYNADDVNSNFAAASPSGPIADDLTDTNNDSLYVIPHNNSQYFEITTNLPDNSAADSTYSPVTYGSTAWSPLGLRNAGDAIQVRAPNGAYWHGVSYGGSEMTGGPNNMKISTSGMGGNCGWFTDGDYLDVANWTTGAVGGNETPGLANNPANLAWLRAMRDPNGTTCPIVVLPVELSYFNGIKDYKGNVLTWETISEVNSAYFRLEYSTDGKTWESIDTENGAGNSSQSTYYNYVHTTFRSDVNYYRLYQIDFDGTEHKIGGVVVIDNRDNAQVGLVKITNLMGQEIDESAKGVQIHVFADGTIKRIYKP